MRPITINEFLNRWNAARDGNPDQQDRNWAVVAEFYLDAMTSGTDVYHVFRGKAALGGIDWARANLEEEIWRARWAFENPLNPQSKYHLKMVRRFYFRRMAWGRAWALNTLLRERGDWRPWLWKDFLLPRAGLALIVGYGALFGAGNVAGMLAKDLQSSAWPYFVFLVGLLSWWLIWLNIRDQMWGTPQGGAIKRSLLAFVVLAFLWIPAYSMVAYCLFPSSGITAEKAVTVGSAALLLTMLGERFFASNSSISDPL